MKRHPKIKGSLKPNINDTLNTAIIRNVLRKGNIYIPKCIEKISITKNGKVTIHLNSSV